MIDYLNQSAVVMTSVHKICSKISISEELEIFVIPFSCRGDLTKAFELRAINAHQDMSKTFITTSDVNDWEHFGRAVQQSNTISKLNISLWRFRRGTSPITSDIPHGNCLTAFFNLVKFNRSISTFCINMLIITAIPFSDLNFFFKNNPAFHGLHLGSSGVITREHSAHLERSLNDIDTHYKLNIGVVNGSPEHVLRAGGMASELVHVLHAVRMASEVFIKCVDNTQIEAITLTLGDPLTRWRMLFIYLSQESDTRMDLDTAGTAIIRALRTNHHLQELYAIHDNDDTRRPVFTSNNSMEGFSNLLCNNSSLQSVIDSNHSLRKIGVEHQIGVDDMFEGVKEYLNLNQNPNKNQVIHYKIMHHFLNSINNVASLNVLNDSKNVNCLNNIPLHKVALLLGSSAPNKCTAVFNIIRKIPELCDVPDRCSVLDGRDVTSRKDTGKKRRIQGKFFNN